MDNLTNLKNELAKPDGHLYLTGKVWKFNDNKTKRNPEKLHLRKNRKFIRVVQ